MPRRDDATFPALEAPIPFGIAQLFGAGSSLLGGIFGSNAASGAANTQFDAANQASAFEQAAANQAIGGLNNATGLAQGPEIASNQFLQDQLAPYLSTGGTANMFLQNLLFSGDKGLGGLNSILQNPSLTFGNAPAYQPLTAQNFQSSPGYNFQLQQGVEAAQNAGAARTGGLSGNVLKAITGYGTGLANQDWYNANNLNLSNFNASQLQPWQQNIGLLQNTNANAFNVLNGLANSGKGVAGTIGGAEINLGNQLGGQGINAATQGGNWLTSAANQVGSNIIGGGNALAAGQIGSANALAGGFGGAATSLLGGSGGNSGSGGLNGLLASIFGGGGNFGGGSFGGDFGGFMA